MNKLMRQALDDILTGDEALLSGFGLERRTTVGAPLFSETYLWDERLTLRGNGNAGLSTRRSIADVSGAPIGDFLARQGKEDMLGFVRLIRDARLDEMQPFRIEPVETKIRLTVVAGGVSRQNFIGVTDPAALAPLQPILQELDRLAAAVSKNPTTALSLGLEISDATPANINAQRTVTLNFRNIGPLGFWIAHPQTVAGDPAAGDERCALLYGHRAEVPPDVTPLPMQMRAAALVAAERDDQELLWIPGASEVKLTFTADLDFDQPGLYLMRAVYAAYSGEDAIGGQRRLRGCVFSDETQLRMS